MVLTISFVDVDMLIESVAKVVPRASLPNNGVGYDMLLGQHVLSYLMLVINIPVLS